MNYREMSIEQLFKKYQFENDRIDKRDAFTTKKFIVNELYRRIKSSIDFLEDAQTETEAEKIYTQFMNH